MGYSFKTLCLFFFLRDENVASQELLIKFVSCFFLWVRVVKLFQVERAVLHDLCVLLI